MKKQRLSIGAILCCLVMAAPVFAWEHHPVITWPILATMPEVIGQDKAPAESLESFLIAVEDALAERLAEQEAWARAHLAWYAPRPDALAFTATGNAADIRERFFRAIRINPGTRTPLYICRLAEDAEDAASGLPPGAVTLLPDTAGIERFTFVPLEPGTLVHPLDIAGTASNEPDFGMDVGLFVDNNTPFGAEYGFGNQAFGDPDLDYGSQAPFHMGFYHESWLVFLFAGFLRESYPEYRIHLFKTLSELAFEQGHDYWGWRFMGWGLHYLADLSMPYHATVLPGYTTVRMLLINLLDILGFPRLVDNALQLVSNRHMAIERFQRITLEEAWRRRDRNDSVLQALFKLRDIPSYTHDAPRRKVAREANRLSAEMDRAIETYMPYDFVSNPRVALIDRDDLDQIVTLVAAEHGPEAVEKLKAITAEALVSFAVHGRAYVRAIRRNS